MPVFPTRAGLESGNRMRLRAFDSNSRLVLPLRRFRPVWPAVQARCILKGARMVTVFSGRLRSGQASGVWYMRLAMLALTAAITTATMPHALAAPGDIL